MLIICCVFNRTALYPFRKQFKNIFLFVDSLIKSTRKQAIIQIDKMPYRKLIILSFRLDTPLQDIQTIPPIIFPFFL